MARMSEVDGVRIVALLGWLVLVGSSLAAYRLNWRKTVTMALVWTAIIVGMALAIGAITQS